jgi:hypothetical protein
MGYEFPFQVPDDLTALSAEEFATFVALVRTHAQSTVADDAATPEALVATRDLYATVNAEDTRRTEQAAAATAARAELAAGLVPATAPTEPVPAPDPVPAPAPAPVVPVVPATAASTIDEPPVIEPERFVSMTASSDAPGSGTALATFADAGALIERRLSTYSSSTRPRKNARKVGKNGFVLEGRNLTRHGNVAFRREYPEDLRITDGKNAMTVLEHASSERRLPGGSLLKSVEANVAAGRSLTAAAGWCAPSETIYDLCMLETVDGILDLPEIQAMRGGFFIPEDGGPDFASIFEGIGDDGDVILTEYQVENGVEKVCVEIPCPPFVEVRMDVAYVCITGALLQDRGYPEIVTRFSQGAMVALAHKINESKIARIVAASGGPTTIPTIPGSDDAVSQLLSAIELAIEDIKYRNRMARSATLEVVLPAWVIAPMRAALARRRGVLSINVSDAEILALFTTRNAVPRFVYDWQDAFSGLSGGPGGSARLTEFPDEVQFLVYPAGTWVAAVRDVINLDTVYDNALLTTNQYTALFAEDGFNVMQMCVDSRLYQVGLDPAGIVGCCDAAS